jgi:hypothetical protein
VTDFERSGADVEFGFEAAGFEFTFDGGSGYFGERLERAGDEDETMILARVPDDAGQGFAEDGNFVEMAVDKVARDIGEILFVGVTDGRDAFGWQEASGFESPAEIVGHGNLVVLTEGAEETKFERRLGDKRAIEIEEGSD